MFQKSNPKPAQCPYCFEGTVGFDSTSGQLFCTVCNYIVSLQTYPLKESQPIQLGKLSIPMDTNNNIIIPTEQLDKEEIKLLLKHYNI